MLGLACPVPRILGFCSENSVSLWAQAQPGLTHFMDPSVHFLLSVVVLDGKQNLEREQQQNQELSGAAQGKEAKVMINRLEKK